MNETRRLSLVFPQYYGPALRPYGAALLWFGRLDCVLLPWGSPYPVTVFERLAARARQRQLPLAELFDLTAGWFKHACLVAAYEAKQLEQLEDRITRLAGVGPGGQMQYHWLREQLGAGVEAAFALLDDPELLRVAGCQFIWRCYEYHLELQNLDGVLDALAREERVENGKSRLLAECLANHYASWMPAVGHGWCGWCHCRRGPGQH